MNDPDRLHPNHRYLLAWIERAGPGARVLDFGCGAGEVVAAARARGRDVVGAESFLWEPDARPGEWIREIRDGRLPFDDGAFDLVVSNTVFEHVEDLDGALREIRRVLRPGGRLVAFFPSREVLREGHFGLPFLHRFRRGSPLRRSWALFWRRRGFGYHLEGRAPEQWVDHALDWIDRFTFYRPRVDLLRAFRRHFRVDSREEDFLRFRLARRPGWAALLRVPWIRPAAREFCRRWGGLVLVAVTSGGAPPGSPAS